MKTVIGNRASSILYNWLKINNIKGNVLVPANICESVPATYMKAGCKVIFCDIELNSLEIGYDQFQQVAQKYNINILHFNHTYGNCKRDYEIKLNKFRKLNSNLLIVEDCCLCTPDMKYSHLADIVIYSTGKTKYVNIGVGGFAHIKDKWKYNNIDLEYSTDMEDMFESHVKECHLNTKKTNLDIFLSNWLNSQINYSVEEYFGLVNKQKIVVESHKKRINEIYKDIPGSMPSNYNNWRYNILVENQKECIDALFSSGLYCSSHYMSLGNGYFSDIITPNCNYLYTHVINLFNDFSYTEDQALRTMKILKKIARKASVTLWKQ